MLKRVIGWFNPRPVEAPDRTQALADFEAALAAEQFAQARQLIDAMVNGAAPEAVACMRSRLAAEEGDFAQAAQAAREALRLRPGDLPAMRALAVALCFGPRVEAAFEEQLRQLQQAPQDLPLLHSAALTAKRQARYAQAEALIRRGLALVPEHPQLSGMLAFNQFKQGRYGDEAWLHFVQQIGVNPWHARAHAPGQAWREEIGPAGLRLWHSGGGGDFFHFCRFIALLRARRPAARIELEAPENLREIAAAVPGVDAVVGVGTPLAPGQVHTSLLALPCILGAHEPAQFWGGPYIDARHPLAGAAAGRAACIGIAWRSGASPSHSALVRLSEQLRDVPLERLVAALPESAAIVCLQQGGGVDEEIAALPAAMRARLARVVCRTFGETVRAIREVDVVVSVDTSVAHLAAAMGHRLCVLGDYDLYWAWRGADAVAPWYPRARVLGQEAPDDWGGPLQALRGLLARSEL